MRPFRYNTPVDANLYNKAYEKFTPDWFENSSQVERYLFENNRSLREFWDQYIEQFFANKLGPYRILELGCGLGGMSLHFAAQGHHVCAVDIAQLAIQNARTLAHKKQLDDKIDFLGLDVTSEIDLQQKFDFIFDSHLLHCLTSVTQREAYFHFVRKHLGENAHYLLETMSFHKGLRTPLDYSFDNDYILWKTDKIHGEIPVRKVLPAIELEHELQRAQMRINYLYFHSELTFQVFAEEPDFPLQHLPQTVRLAATYNAVS